jgi:hypothetical protein
MAATYVKITRKELEDWLFELCPVFERDEDTEGLYTCPLSPHVAVKISTTLGQNDLVIRKDAGRCRMSLVRRDNGKELRKPQTSSNASFDRCNRTTGWRDNWADALRGMFASFKGDREHYNRLGSQTQAEYAAEWRERIETVQKWESFDILRDFHEHLGRGRWLTGKQEAAAWKFIRPSRGGGKKRAKKGAKKTASARRKTSGTVDQQLLDALSALQTAAARAGDSWTHDFAAGNAWSRVQAGRALSDRQAEILREKFTKYGVKMPSAVAA